MPVLLIAVCLLGSLAHASPPEETGVVATALLDAGESPRRVLRLAQRPEWGEDRTLVVSPEVETALGTGASEESRTEYGPEISVPLRVAWLANAGRGQTRYRVGVGRPEVRAVDEEDAEPAWRLAEELGAVSGRTGEVVLSETGQLVDAWVRLRPGASAALETLVRAVLSSDWFVTPQFPEAPIGRGARWAVARAHGPGGLVVVAYELVALHGHRGRVRFQLHSRALEGLPAPRVEGELSFDLRWPFPERLEATYSSRTELGSDGPRRLEVIRRTRVTLAGGGSLAPRHGERVAAPWTGTEGQVRAR
ncbi:hypothetical protein [Myxococcus sp. Y35]|uniref:hypothetical protein n=1 Tax=Pseudomyxococcus flavus TaxID=3115648 RepID=UPI003CFA4A3A